MAQEKAMNKPLVGLLVVAVFALIATALAGTDFCQGLKLSSMVVGVLLGMVLANTARPYSLKAGVVVWLLRLSSFSVPGLSSMVLG